MTTEKMETVEEVLRLTDPGEMGREHHGWADRLMVNVGNVVAWMFPVLMCAIVAQVVMRQAGFNQAWLDDGQWWMYGVAMLTAFGYAITTQSHVRVDIFHAHYSAEKKARIEAFAVGWLLMPFMLMMTDVLIHYAWSSIKAGEGSDSPNGLHMLYLLKTALPILFIIAMIAAWGLFKRSLVQFSSLRLHKILLWSIPSAIFIFTRITHYLFYWYTSFTQPDIIARRISKEAIFDYTGTVAVVIVLALLAYSFAKSRKSGSGE
ncbi:MAG: TRAP transporter small permease subunit [Rhodobacteraceae bacterium]|nr:TRAP transporter small permease subunit [Paracoccaceae bacterium]